MGRLRGFIDHPFESIGGVFTHPGKDWSTIVKALPAPVKDIVNPARLVGGDVGYVINHPGHTQVAKFTAKNPLLVAALALDVVTLGGYTPAVYAGYAATASTYANAAAAGTYESGAVHGFNGLRNEMSTGPTRSDYMTGAEFAAAEGIGSYVDPTGGAVARLGSGFATLRSASALGLNIFPGPTLGPNATPEQISNAQLQSDITGQPISLNSNQNTTASGSSGGVGAPGTGGVLGGGSALNTTGLVLLGTALVAAAAS